MTVSVRYIVGDVAAAVSFYTRHLGFTSAGPSAPGFARLTREGLVLLLNAPGAGGAGQDLGGATPAPGGWNRFQLTVEDVSSVAEQLADQGVRLRGPMVTGKGGRQLVIEDPAGNPVELFEPAQAAQPAAR